MGEYLPKYLPGASQTRIASAAITGGQLLIVTGTNTVGPSTAGAITWCGVAGNDAASGASVTVFSGGVQRLVATGTVTAGQTVEPATAGTVATHTPGTNELYAVGLALTTATAGNLVDVQMER